MKKLLKSILIVVLCLSLCGCAPVQASLADMLEEAYGTEGKSYEEHEAYYQAEWDALYADIGELLGIAADEVEVLLKDMLDDLLEELKNQVLDLLGIETIDWESITEADKVTLATIKDENGFTSHYNNRFSKGQCTWYAFGRFAEKTDIPDLKVHGNAKTWLDNCTDDRVHIERDLEKIVPGSIAVDYKHTDPGHPGHVTYVEHVTYDDNGNPVEVYFTESNWDSNGHYDEGVDAIVKTLPFAEFVERGNHRVKGYIIPND